jgi:hypothetical protein
MRRERRERAREKGVEDKKRGGRGRKHYLQMDSLAESSEGLMCTSINVLLSPPITMFRKTEEENTKSKK